MQESLLTYAPVNPDKLGYYQAICRDSHQGKDPHCQIQAHSTIQLTLPRNRKGGWLCKYCVNTLFIDYLFQFAANRE